MWIFARIAIQSPWSSQIPECFPSHTPKHKQVQFLSAKQKMNVKQLSCFNFYLGLLPTNTVSLSIHRKGASRFDTKGNSSVVDTNLQRKGSEGWLKPGWVSRQLRWIFFERKYIHQLDKYVLFQPSSSWCIQWLNPWYYYKLMEFFK